MRVILFIIPLAIAASAIGGDRPIFLKGSEVNDNQGLFLAMPTSTFPEETAGPVTVKIQPPTVGGYGYRGLLRLTQPDTPFTINVWLANSAPAAVRGTLRVSVIDRWRADPSGPVPFELAPQGWKRIQFTLSFGHGTFNAEYPVYATVEFEHEGQQFRAHPVLLLKPELSEPPRAMIPVVWEPQAVPEHGALALWRLPAHRQRFVIGDAFPFAVWRELGFTSMEPVEFGVPVQRGVKKESFRVHLGTLPPSKRQDLRMAMVEYPLALPAAHPLRCEFSVAVADSLAKAGALFRLRVLPFSAPDTEEGATIWERRVTATEWERVEADLRRFAGQKVRLQFETRGDSTGEAYWAEPSLVAGSRASNALFPPAASQKYRVLGSAGGYEVRLWPGKRGILDTTVGFVQGGRQLLFQGFGLRVLGDALGERSTVSELVEAREEGVPEGYRIRNRFKNWAGSFDVLAELRVDRGGLTVRFWLENTSAPRPWVDPHLEEVTTGPWSERAVRIYAGQGNVIQEPKAFRASYGAYAVGTSYAGFDFENGTSLLQGVDVTPNGLQADPAKRVYTLNTALAHTVTFLPAPTVWQAAKLWRDRSGLRAAPSVSELAGRFAFDLWDGRYGATARALERAFRYGLTDSVVVFHNWQYWGYDYRLPDIYPPNPDLGTLDELRGLADTCRRNGVLFAPHDNYMDFYPNADGFSYENLVTFDASGEPQRGWYNAAMQTQAYHVSPGAARGHVERNVRLIREGFHPSAYFIDVWGGDGGSDYWTHDGQFHERTAWRKDRDDIFNWIRDYLGSNAPQISEGGTDQDIGAIDGSQTMHLRAASLKIESADAERIPWFDFAYHDRLAMHGAGYHERYHGGPNAAEHGVYSDDYMATEVLTGHPPMVIAPFGREVVRKYWLLHGLMRALALARMDDVEFAGGDMHRQRVRWEGGGAVIVNRGAADWEEAGRTLPPYGFYAHVRQGSSWVEAAFEKIGGKAVEWSRSADTLYVNGRGETADCGAVETAGAVRLNPGRDSLLATALPEGGDFRIRLRWDRLPWKLPIPQRVETLDENGEVTGGNIPQFSGDDVVLTYQRGVFAYRLR